ncbi:unnamed protein product [Amaranthus hypochondriacus]
MKLLTQGTTLGTIPMFSASSLFSVYASLTALVTLIQQFYHQFIPTQVRQYITLKIQEWFTKSNSSTKSFTLVIEQFDDADYDSYNQVFYACEAYLTGKLRSCSTRLKVSRPTKKDQVLFKLAQGEKYNEVYENVELEWNFICSNSTKNSQYDHEDGRSSFKPRSDNKVYFELVFDLQYKDKVFDSYIPHIMKLYDEKSEKEKDLKLFSLDNVKQGGSWRSVKFKHPFTFEALAMEPGLKKEIMDDLERFIGRKEFYKKVGRAWKRGYLLYGPPGTGKSSLIAAMANYLKFDIYDLQLSSVINDSALRRLLLFTTNKSILVIEDIDCSLRLADRQLNVSNDHEADINSQISLSGLLNFIDGLWSSCGDERIFIFTTNHKDKLDPALLRPGRMDMHIHMSYLTMPAFRILAHNYLNISDEHHLFNEIEQLIETTKVSPAQVAEVLIRSDDPEISLSSVITMLKQHKLSPVQEKIHFPNLMNGAFSNGIGHDDLSSADDFSDD